ncbi:hypothetical protein BFP97_02755 [Roseivirga sp. 4D4]|uniref:ABC transporter permease n=1 Tax=Roseivirga sp. 4D4 TaxID=1889784 RepID=UPI000853D9D2|nr:ABC transporter permease [Roseivirga sp. 4D4]OEK00494.1 hypothetical protein BFP97_02755 [Roseivirga sp. 4D4]
MSDRIEKPPRWADRFLGWYCNPKLLEQIQGDVHELFYWRLEEKGIKQAKRSFAWDVIRLFRWSNIKRKSNKTQNSNNIGMFKNYFKIGLRNLWKQRMPSTINMIGLSLAVGCCLVAFKYIEFQLVRDSFHENGDRIYLGTHQAFEENDVHEYGYFSWAIGDLIRENYAGVKNVVQYNTRGVEVNLTNRSFGEYAAFTTKEYFDVFSFDVLYGEKEVLAGKDKIGLAEQTAKRYFNDEYPIGKTVAITIGSESYEFEVGVVFEEAPNNSSLRPEVIIHPDFYTVDADPKETTANFFLELEEGVAVQEVLGQLQSLVEVQNGFNLDRKYEAIGLEPLTTMAKNADRIRYGIGSVPPMAPMILLACIASFMLILATFNYINIATAMATRRIKEIGIRKVIGSKRGQLVVQFLTENFILCALAISVGCLLAAGFFIPKFNVISGSTLELDILNHANLQIFLLGLLFFLTFASGAYPAFFVSRFKPVRIFRGAEKVGGKRRFTMALLTFQFVLAMITIVAGVSSVQNNNLYESKAWGYNQNDKLVVNLSKENFQAFRSEAMKNPNVLDVAASFNSLNNHWDFRKMKVGELEYEGQYLRSDAYYPEFMEIPLVEGRYFDKKLPSDLTSAVLVNEAFVKAFQLEDFVGTTVTIDSANFQVVGVLKDYFYSSFQDGIEPAVFKAEADSLLTTLTFQARSGTMIALRDELEETWSKVDSETAFSAHFQSDVREREFEDMRGLRNVLVFTASLAVLLSAMGLFGLVSLSISARFKDFGIKKVLGASALSLLRDVYKRFSFIVLFAVVAGSLLAVKVVSLLLVSVYGEHLPVDIIPLGLASLLLLIVAALTINIQMRRVRLMNPAETLRTE